MTSDTGTAVECDKHYVVVATREGEPGALEGIISAYDAYRRRGVNPAPKEYEDVVKAIDASREQGRKG